MRRCSKRREPWTPYCPTFHRDARPHEWPLSPHEYVLRYIKGLRLLDDEREARGFSRRHDAIPEATLSQWWEASGRLTRLARAGSDSPATPILKVQPQRPSEVYFLVRGEHIKIGRSVDVCSRVRAFQQTMADVLATIPGGADVEAEWHTRFDHLRDRETYGGQEWFRADDELLEAISEVA